MSVSVCSDGHVEVCYDNKTCPACDYGRTEYERGLSDGYDNGYDEGRQDGCEHD